MAALYPTAVGVWSVSWPKVAAEVLRAVSSGAFGRLILHDGHAGLARTVDAVGGSDALRIIRGMEISMGGVLSRGECATSTGR